MWVDLPLSVTPYYEIMFVIQVLSLFIFSFQNINKYYKFIC